MKEIGTVVSNIALPASTGAVLKVKIYQGQVLFIEQGFCWPAPE